MAKKKKKDIMFETVALEWLETKRSEVKLASYVQYEIALKEKIFEKLSGKKMKTVCKRETLEKLEKAFFEEGYASKTVQNYLTIVKMVIYYYQGMIREVGYCDNYNGEFFSIDEARKIVTMAKRDKEHNDFKKLGILIIMYTGINISELCALKWDDINLEDNVIGVYDAVARVTNAESGQTQIIVYDTPTPRCIPIHSQLAKVLNMYICNAVDDECYILTNSYKPMEPRSFQYGLKTFCKSFGKSYSASEMREMFIITSLKNGMSPVVLADVLGITIENLYRKYEELIVISEEQKAREMRKLSY